MATELNTIVSNIQPALLNERNATNQSRNRSHPVVTTGITLDYIEACCRSNEKASARDPLTTLFQAEKLPPIPDEDTYINSLGRRAPTLQALRARLARHTQQEIENMVYTASLNRLDVMKDQGAFIAEAGKFAATTCWEPSFAPRPSDALDGSDANTLSFPEKPLFEEFINKIERARVKHLYPALWTSYKSGSQYKVLDHWTESTLSTRSPEDKALLFWHLCLTSRNPAVQPPVPGAVRAVIEPFVKRWADEAGMPVVWLEAGSERARDVYAYFGFRVVDEVVVGEDMSGSGIKTWCMMYTRDR